MLLWKRLIIPNIAWVLLEVNFLAFLNIMLEVFYNNIHKVVN